MTHYYVFNGDADGLCALHQLRLTTQNQNDQTRLITGVKRDINLLERVVGTPDDEITVLDISLDVNRTSLLDLLEKGASVRYFDHHYSGKLPTHPRFQPYINESPSVCTSIIVDEYCENRFQKWAIVAAFGDNLSHIGAAMAQAANIEGGSIKLLKELGTYLNYNAYGETLNDLHFHPEAMAALMLPYEDPIEFIRNSTAYAELAEGYCEDMGKIRPLKPELEVNGATLIILPAESWARRASGVFANEKVQANPMVTIAIVTPKTCGNFAVSLRVPATSLIGAAEFCRRFNTGGGRKLAGGINHLPATELSNFTNDFIEFFKAA